MRAWVVRHPGPIDRGPLVAVEREPPVPGPGEILVDVAAAPLLCAGIVASAHLAADTRADGEELLAVAARIVLHVETIPYGLADADRALRDLAGDGVRGAAVLVR